MTEEKKEITPETPINSYREVRKKADHKEFVRFYAI